MPPAVLSDILPNNLRNQSYHHMPLFIDPGDHKTKKEKRKSVFSLVPPFNWICLTIWSAIWFISCLAEMIRKTLIMKAIRMMATRI